MSSQSTKSSLMKLSESLANEAVKHKVIKPEEAVMYSLLYENLIFSAVTWSTFLVMGLITRNLIGCVVFILFFVPMRVYSGGLHQNTRLKCYVQSLIIFALVFVGAHYSLAPQFRVVLPACAVCIIPLVIKLSPVETKNKPLTIKEQHVYRIIATIISIVFAIIISVFALLNLDCYLYFSGTACITVAGLMILGHIRNAKAASPRRGNMGM